MFIDYSPSPSIFIYYSSDVTPFSSSHRDSDFRKTAVRSESMINELSQIGIIKRNEDTRGNSTPTWNFSQVRKSPLCTNFHLNVHLRKKKIKTPRTRSKDGRKIGWSYLSGREGGAIGRGHRPWPSRWKGECVESRETSRAGPLWWSARRSCGARCKSDKALNGPRCANVPRYGSKWGGLLIYFIYPKRGWLT